MNSFKITTIVLALGFAAGIGCGSDSGTKTDGPVITGTGGHLGPDALGAGGTAGTVGPDAAMGGAGGTAGVGVDAAGGAGGSMPVDGPMATGGVGGAGLDGGGAGGTVIDASPADAPMPTDTVVTPVDGLGGEVAAPTNLCTGLTVDQCNLAIINAPVDSTVLAQTPPATNPPDYAVCSVL